MAQSVITTLEVQKRDKERVNVYLDGAYAFSLNSIDAAHLRKGQILTEAEIAALQSTDKIVQAVNHAAGFLSYRPRSQAEVRQNLTEKGFAPEVIEAAIARLETLGYVDDHAFTRFWIENRSSFKPISQRALRYELQQKGVSSAIINEMITEVDETAAAYSAAQTRLRRLRGSQQKDFRLKLREFLMRRGFSGSISSEVIAQLIEELEAQQPDYFGESHRNTDLE